MASISSPLREFDDLQGRLRSVLAGALNQTKQLEFAFNKVTKEKEELLNKMLKIETENAFMKEKIQSLKCQDCRRSLLNSEKSNSSLTSSDNPGLVGALSVEEAEEVEAISRINLDTQFEDDSNSCDVVIPLQMKVSKGVHSEVLPSLHDRPVLQWFLNHSEQGAEHGQEDSNDSIIIYSPVMKLKENNQSRVRESNEKSVESLQGSILVRETPAQTQQEDTKSPALFVPDTMSLSMNEVTPQKTKRTSIEETPHILNLLRRSPSVKIASVHSLTQLTNSTGDLSQIVSPYKGTEDRTPPITPKRAKKSPRNSPRRTSTASLSRRRLPNLERTMNGFKKLSQSQLNIKYFKNQGLKTDHHKEQRTPNTTMKEQQKTQTCSEPCPKGDQRKRKSPLHDLGNSPELNETNLSLSALARVDPDVLSHDLKKKNVISTTSDNFLNTFDKYPDLTPGVVNLRCKEARRLLPGHECGECQKYFNHFECNEEEKKRILDLISRHRTNCDVDRAETPPGYWNPMIAESLPDDPS